MINKTTIFLVVVLPAVSVLVFLFMGLPFLNQINEQSRIQENNTVSSQQFDSAVRQVVNYCVENPSNNCDEEMSKIMDFCKQNKDQNPPICADERVLLYLNQRVTHTTVNGGP